MQNNYKELKNKEDEAIWIGKVIESLMNKQESEKLAKQGDVKNDHLANVGNAKLRFLLWLIENKDDLPASHAAIQAKHKIQMLNSKEKVGDITITRTLTYLKKDFIVRVDWDDMIPPRYKLVLPK